MSIRQSILPAWPIFFGISLIMVGNGLQGTLLGLRASIEGFSPVQTGIIMSFYYAGFMAGTIWVPRLVKDVGHIRVFAALASLASSTVLLHGIFVDPMFWTATRMITGFSYAGLYVVVESWLNDVSTSENRGRMLSFYMLLTYASMMAGQYFLNLGDPAQIELFILTSILVSLALLPVSLTRQAAPDFSKPSRVNIKTLYKASPLGLLGVFVSGFGAASFFTIAPVYAVTQGMSVSAIANLMVVFILGGVLAQMPLGLLSDKIERRKMLIFMCGGTAFMGGLCFLATQQDVSLYPPLLFYGALSLSIYSIATAYTNDHCEPDQRVGVSSTLLLINGSGAILGPVTVSAGINYFGNIAFFPIQASVFLLLAFFAIWRAQVTKAVPVEDQSHYVSVPVRSSQIITQIAEDEYTDTP